MTSSSAGMWDLSRLCYRYVMTVYFINQLIKESTVVCTEITDVGSKSFCIVLYKRFTIALKL